MFCHNPIVYTLYHTAVKCEFSLNLLFSKSKWSGLLVSKSVQNVELLRNVAADFRVGVSTVSNWV